jgi:hypothetical protein
MERQGAESPQNESWFIALLAVRTARSVQTHGHHILGEGNGRDDSGTMAHHP